MESSGTSTNCDRLAPEDLSEHVMATLRYTVPQDDEPIVYLVDYESTTIKLEERTIAKVGS